MNTIKNSTESAIPTKSRPQIVFTYVGTLEFRGRLQKEIATLQAAGYECSLIYGDSGERPLIRENFDFPIRIIPTPGKYGKWILFLMQLRFGILASRLLAKSNATHVVGFSLESMLAGSLAKRRRRDIKLIFDSNELHIECYIHPLKKKIWSPIQKFCAKHCDVIMHAEPNRLEYFLKHHDPPGKRKHFLLENFPKFIPRVDLKQSIQDKPTRVLYVGMLGADRFTLDLIDIFENLGSGFSLDLVGPASPEFNEELQRRLGGDRKSNVRVLPSIPYSEMGDLIRKYHIGIALYKNNSLNNYYCAPNKVYDYLMNGVPVVANNYPGLERVIEGGKVGACIDEVTLESFRSALSRIMEERKWENITEDMRKRHSWEGQSTAFLSLFE